MHSTTALDRSRPLLIAVLPVLTLGLVATLASSAAVQGQKSQELGTIVDSLQAVAGEVEHIAEDREHIHEDTHTVAFSLRLMSFASVGIFVVLLLSLAAPRVKRS